MNGKQHMIDIVFILSLFCVFAVLALFVVVQGADVYRGISADMDRNYQARTSVAYLTEKIRQNDVPGGVVIKNAGDGDALVLVKNMDGERYETWIYTEGGSLREQTIAEGTELSAEAGQPVLDAGELKIEKLGDHLLQISVKNLSGERFDSVVAMKSAGGME